MTTFDDTASQSQLYFLSEWLPGNKENTWSGTNWGLYQALKKYLCVNDIDIYRKRTFERILRKLRILPKADLELLKIRNAGKFVKPLLPARQGKANEKTIVFQFAEILKDSPALDTYIYQDLAVPYIQYMQQYYPDDFAVSSFQTVPPRFIPKRALQQMNYYQHCAGIFTMGKWLKHFLVEQCHIPDKKVHAVGGDINVNPSLISPDAHKNSKRILFIGRDYIRKGLPELYAAFCLLKQTVPDAELYVAGPAANPYPQAVEGYHFMGDCTHEKLSELFNLCDVFAMPSHFEAYGLVFIEALCYGLPCLARNAYEMSYFIEDGKTGVLVDSYDAPDMAAKLHRLLNDEEIKKNVANRRDLYIKEYSWDTVAGRIADVIKAHKD